jgi:hypothetical protein
VSAKAKWFFLEQEVPTRIGSAEDVLPLLRIIERRVDRGKVLEIQPQWPISQPRLLGIAELPPCKCDPGSRILIEVCFLFGLHACFIVIAHDDSATQAADHLDAFSGIRAVTHNVAQADHLLHSLRRNVGKHCFQSFKIAMDVGKDCELHEILHWELPATSSNRQPVASRPM